MPDSTSTQPLKNADSAQKMLAWALTERLETPTSDGTLDLPGYIIKDTLGKGGMGTVYRAIHMELGRTVALKIFSPQGDKNDLFVERLNREGRLMAQLKHPNVLGIYDADVLEDGTPYLVLEFVKGEDLSKRLKDEKKLPIKSALRIAIKVCDALSAVHGLGIVHRDIKPANVLLGQNGSVKVTDFGISKETITSEDHTALTLTGTTVGTVDYMSPEQTKNEEVTTRSDLYSVGVLLYEMISGVTPRGNFEPLTKYGASKRLNELVMRCLQRDQSKRPASAETLALSLRRIYLNLTKRKHHNYRAIIFAGIAGVATVGIIAYLMLRDRNGATPSVDDPEDPPIVKDKPLDGEVGEWANMQEYEPTARTKGWWVADENFYCKEHENSRLFFQFWAGYDYQLSATITRVQGTGGIAFFLPTSRGLCTFELDINEQNQGGIQLLNGVNISEQTDEQRFKLPINNGSDYRVNLTVTTKKITAKVNGEQVGMWELSNTSLSTAKHWGKRPPFKLGLGAHTNAIFSNVRVKRLK